MTEIFNCWQCQHYDHMSSLCKKNSSSCAAFDPICEDFAFKTEDKYKIRQRAKQELNKKFGIVKKKESASSRIVLIAEEIKWLRLDPCCHDRMVYDSLSTIETMLKHLSTSIKNTDRDFEMKVVTHE